MSNGIWHYRSTLEWKQIMTAYKYRDAIYMCLIRISKYFRCVHDISHLVLSSFFLFLSFMLTFPSRRTVA